MSHCWKSYAASHLLLLLMFTEESAMFPDMDFSVETGDTEDIGGDHNKITIYLPFLVAVNLFVHFLCSFCFTNYHRFALLITEARALI